MVMPTTKEGIADLVESAVYEYLDALGDASLNEYTDASHAGEIRRIALLIMDDQWDFENICEVGKTFVCGACEEEFPLSERNSSFVGDCCTACFEADDAEERLIR